MCAEHRSEVIKEIKENLEKGEAIRLISTQLVEAGVDIDFPVVYRQIAGLDSIAQAAGRCNREGKLELGKVVVFNFEKESPIGLLRKATQTTQNLPLDVLKEPLNPASFKTFFEFFYGKVNSLDRENIIELLVPDRTNLGIQFKEASEKFNIIDDENQETIIVPYLNGKKYIDLIKNSEIPEFAILRKLQRYMVNVRSDKFSALKNRDSLDEILPGVFALKCEIEYSHSIGLLIDEMPNDLKNFIH
jgi:CRISPR-associated endonuclease/helicase Cas3